MQNPPPLDIARDVRGRIGVPGLKPVSPKLIRVRYLGGIAWYVIGLGLAAGCVVTGILLDWWWMHLIAVPFVLLVAQSLLFIPRRVRALGYADREDEIVIAGGIMFRTVTSVPYGRIQSVEIEQGPIERAHGLANLSIATAAGGTLGNETVPGLPREEAERLRELLARRGADLMAAL